MEPMSGLEPLTYWLRISCSTTWATSALTHIYHQQSAAKPKNIAPTSLRLKNILNILTVCFRVFFCACLAESTLTYSQPFSNSRDDLDEKCGFTGHLLKQVPKMNFLDVSILWYSVKIMKGKLTVLFCCLLIVAGCQNDQDHETKQTERPEPTKITVQFQGCRTCHPDIRHDQNHDFPCIQCHKGNEQGEDEKSAHSGLVKKPAHPDFMMESCGVCHPENL